MAAKANTSKALGSAGRALWDSILGEAPQLGARDRALLDQACRQADAVADLERRVADAYGREWSKLAGELRQARLALSRLLGSVSLPRSGTSAASEHARHAANVRWGHAQPGNGSHAAVDAPR